MKKADYAKIAPSYDKGASLSQQNIDLWLGLIAKHSGATVGARVLDLGCGTGRFALPMARQLGFCVTAYHCDNTPSSASYPPPQSSP
ncbi:MAG: class I SAM-dependent methyltransferase [Anaerolineae bacterium]|nr:class I SAM-dependent methyltransferase [Anaerolineae bacterium]